jgi:hypothetical protein
MKYVPALATLAAGCALAVVIAYWGWQLFGPAPVHLASPTPSDPAATILAANLFGTRGAAPQAASGEALLSSDTQLLGIIAERDRGLALFRTSGGTKLVAQGDDIAPGVKLVAVGPDAIRVRDGAGEHRVELRANPGGAPARTAAANGVRAARATSVATCAPPAGFRGGVVRLNAELLGGLANDPSTWRALLAPAPGGLVVQADSGFGAMLGLHAGDRISQANGIALRVPEDIATAVIRPLIANQGVRVVGARGGAPQEVWLANVACAG